MANCPLDGSRLREETLATIAYFVCPTCAGMWLEGDVTRALLDGSLTLPEDVLRLGGSIEERLRTPAVPATPTAATTHVPSRARHRIVRCARCSTRIRPADGAEVATCIRCGGLWIPGGDMGALVRWYRTALQLRLMATLKPARVRYGRWRDIDEHGDFSRMLVVLAAAVAFFVLAPANGGLARVGLSPRTLMLGAGSVGMMLHGFRYPSKTQPGALTRKGFAFALGGITLGVLAFLSWG